MAPELAILLSLILGLSGVIMFGAQLWAHRGAAGARPRVRSRSKALRGAAFSRNAILNSLTSVAMVYGFAWAFDGRLLTTMGASFLTILAEGVAILAIYDFVYYLMHRYPFHEWTLLRQVHAVHHRVREPLALDSLYLHPLENIIGLGLLWASTALVGLLTGGVNIYAFSWAFFVYSVVNILLHAGIDSHTFPMNIMAHLSHRHDLHHTSMRSTNYGSISPLWDRLFGTEEG